MKKKIFLFNFVFYELKKKKQKIFTTIEETNKKKTAEKKLSLCKEECQIVLIFNTIISFYHS